MLSHPRKVWNHSLYIAAMRLDDGDLLIVATAKAFFVLVLISFVTSSLTFISILMLSLTQLIFCPALRFWYYN